MIRVTLHIGYMVHGFVQQKLTISFWPSYTVTENCTLFGCFWLRFSFTKLITLDPHTPAHLWAAGPCGAWARPPTPRASWSRTRRSFKRGISRSSSDINYRVTRQLESYLLLTLIWKLRFSTRSLYCDGTLKLMSTKCRTQADLCRSYKLFGR